MSTHRIRRGAETQRIVAAAWKADGWPYAEPVGAGAPGRDMTGTPGIGAEIKARRDLDLTGWLRQTTCNARADVPVLIVRPDGYGPATVDDWPAIVPHGALRRLLRLAGYGEPLTTTDAKEATR
ncbi:MAG TPA: hypothetical protein VF755_02785 [Catenuloplanes sp.]